MWPCTELVSPASCIPRRFPTTGWCRGGGSATLPAVGASPPSSAQPARQSPGCCCNLNQPHRALLAAPSLWEPLARLPLNTLTPGLGAKAGLATHTGGSTWRCGLGAVRLLLFKEYSGVHIATSSEGHGFAKPTER